MILILEDTSCGLKKLRLMCFVIMTIVMFKEEKKGGNLQDENTTKGARVEASFCLGVLLLKGMVHFIK